MNQRLHTVDWGSRTIEFALQRADRKRVAIEVSPDQSVLVKAPKAAELQPVLEVVKKKARWIIRQQRYFEQFKPRTPERLYVSGESHLYKGRRYRLKIHAVDDEQGVKLLGGYIHIYCSDAKDKNLKQRLLEQWYRRHADRLFRERLEACLDQRVFRLLSTPPITIRRLKKRWGSCTSAGWILLNLDLIRAPMPCIDYVITHELCHLMVPDHSARFSQLLLKVMPDWRARKDRLEQALA